ncbi:outer membrane beta-barrel protein [Flavobacterium sp. Fl-318]|uniref:Outer membrane beta-barrel protein n=1 Tax=Flavobacterium cupriresistens TaxID=2893885 RepID=A0ABU4RDW4_9FLAO|nr:MULTISPECIES: outer membrane beta-barrel protein [unclassified Flavobacterium]MDX6190776.1 outer membrane beta-barrel protein [Flavobacterium sp. Fl-318]UFH44050.1 porin family protein [Flavobacterium sp. F-323]
MKKILVIVVFAMFSYANAQKGSVLVMGSVYYNSETVSELGSDNKSHYFGFTPKVGYQFHENWTTGIEVGISTSKQGNSNSDYKDKTLSTGGFLRYSKPLSETFCVYADLGLGFQKRKETYQNDFAYTVNEGDGFYIGLTPALLINVGKGFGLNFNIGGLKYDTLNYNENEHSEVNRKRFNFNLGQAFSFGISKNF